MESFAILTTEANEAVAAVHDRMPVILPADRVEDWLAAAPGEALALLQPYAGALRVRAILKLVGNPRNDTPEVLGDA